MTSISASTPSNVHQQSPLSTDIPVKKSALEEKMAALKAADAQAQAPAAESSSATAIPAGALKA